MRTLLLALLLVSVASLPIVFADEADEGEARARAAFADRDYSRGVALFDELVAKSPDHARSDYWGMMAVRGRSLAEDHQAVVSAGEAFLSRHPGSLYREKVAFLAARALLLTGRGADASELMGLAVERLRAPAARAYLVGYYLRAADRAYEGVAPKGPFDPGVKPDFARAHKLYGLARDAGIPERMRIAVLGRYARAAVKTRGFARALEVLDELDEQGGTADPARLLLRGRALLGLGSGLEARDVLERLVAVAPTSTEAPLGLRLLDDPTHLERLVREYPTHETAPEAAFRRGQLLAAEGSVDSAVQAFADASARFPGSPFAPRASLAAADSLAKAGRHEEAQGRYGEFLKRFPESPDWAAARKRLIEAWYRRGRAALDRGEVEPAGKVWTELRGAYPLSPLAPRTLTEEASASPHARSLTLLGEVVARYPASPQAPRAALEIARLRASEPGGVADAVKALETVLERYGKSQSAGQARQLLDEMQRESLMVSLPAVLPPGAPGRLEIETRNLKSLSGRVYRIDPEAYFEKHGSFDGLANVMVEVIAPDAEFEHEVKAYEDHRLVTASYELPVKDAGAYVVVVEGGKLTASCLLLLSDLTVVTKEWPRGVLAFVQERAGGKPVPGAGVTVRNAAGKLVRAFTGPDGVARIALDNSSGKAGVLAHRGDSVAFEGYSPTRRRVRGLTTRVHIATDRPVYRPGHEVRYRAVVRRASGEFLVTPAGQKVRLSVTDGAGNRLHDVATTLDAFGAAAGSFRLPADIPPRRYQVVAEYHGGTYRGAFVVEAYRKPQLFLEVVPVRPDYVRGEKVELDVTARYSFGQPVRDLPVKVAIRLAPEPVDVDALTGADGHVRVGFTTHPGGDLVVPIRVEARDATGRLYVVRREIQVPRAAFQASVTTSRDRVFVGEQVKVRLAASDVLGKPVAAKGAIDVGRSPSRANPPAFALEAKIPVAAGEDGRAEVAFSPGVPGRYRFLFRGLDRAGTEVTAAAEIVVLGTETERIVVRADRSTYSVGDVAEVRLASPAAGGYALVTYEGEEVYGHHVVKLLGGPQDIALPVTARFVPDVRIRAAAAVEGRLLEGEDRIEVLERLNVTVSAARADYGPGDVCRVTVTTADDGGKPVPAQVALAVVDEGVFRLHPDGTPDLVATFRPPPRKDLVRTGSSLDFTYRGRAVAISEDLVAERHRRADADPEADNDMPFEESIGEKDFISDAPFEGPSTNAAIGIGGGAGGTFGGRGGRRNLRAAGGGKRKGEEESLAVPRRSFQDTAFFRADVVTGADGTASVEFTLPDDLTEWRVTARGASRGNAFGKAGSSFTTSLPLVIRAALPRYLRVDDRLTAAVGVVNGMAEDVEARVLLFPTHTETLTVPAGEERRVDWPLDALIPGVIECSARVRTKGLAADREERKLRVLPFGVKFRTGFAGVSTDPGHRSLTVPEQLVPGSETLTLHVAPTLTRAALDGLGELRDFPYGCTEQTVNRFLPALEAARTIRDLGLDQAGALPRLGKMARAGALRLTYLQNREGLWGWWGNGPTDAEMTAYALLALARAREAGIDFSPAALDRAKKAMPKLIARTTDPDNRAFLHLAASWAFGADFAALAPAFADRRRLSLRGLSHLAMAYEPLGESVQRSILVDEVARAAGSRTPDDLETLGFALAAVAGLDPASGPARELSWALVRMRQGKGFGTTRATGAAVMGLARAARGSGAPSEGARVGVKLNGVHVLEEAIPVAGSRTFTVPAEKLRPGENRVEVVGTGGGTVFYSLALTCTLAKAPASDPTLAVERTLSLVPRVTAGRRRKLVREGVAPREPEVSVLRAGELSRVTLRIENRARERYLVVEDPIPAGFEPVAGTEKGAFAEALRHDDRMVFFIENAPEKTVLSYVVQSEAPGRVGAPPTLLYAMYRPEAAAWSAPVELRVADFGEALDRDPTVGLGPSELWCAALAAEKAGRREDAERYIEALLGRYDLLPGARADALLHLARLMYARDHHEGAAACFDRLFAENPSARLGLADEVLRASAYRELDRHGDAVTALERAAFLLLMKDAQVPDALGPGAAPGLAIEILDRHPFGTFGESAWVLLANRRATAYEETVAAGGRGDPAHLRVMRELVARYPKSGAAPEVSFRLARAYLRSRQWERLETEVRRFSDRYPRSRFADDADWFLAYALFAQDRYEEAEASALVSLAKGYPSNEKGEVKTAFEKSFLHLLAKVAHIGGRLDEATRLYEKVARHTPDAREAFRRLTEMRLEVPAVFRVRTTESVTVELTVKNVDEVRLMLYPIDLLAYFALRKDVDRVAALNLDGLLPASEVSVKAGGGRDARNIRAPVADLAPGVYLVFARAGGIERRTIVIKSDLEARVRRHADGARVIVTDARSGEPVRGAFVKVASGDKIVGEGRTDARGVFEVRGKFREPFSAVAKKDGSYALASR